MSRIFPTRAAIVAFAAVAALLGACSPAQAAFKLKLTTSQGATKTIEDNVSIEDTEPTAGGIAFNGVVGVWNINVVIGLSKPVLGSDGASVMNIAGSSTKTGKTKPASTLTIELTDTGFTTPTDGFRTLTSMFNSANAINGSIKFQSFVANNNGTEFETTTRTTPGQGMDDPNVWTTGVQSSGPGTVALDFPLTTPFSMTQRIRITAKAGTASASYDATTSVTPEPSSMLLGVLGAIPLLGGAWLRKRRTLAVA